MLDRLTAQDLLMLGADDFGWSEDIGVLAILDGSRLLDGDGRVRIDEVRRRLEAKLHLVPRFRQLLYRPGRGLGRPRRGRPGAGAAGDGAHLAPSRAAGAGQRQPGLGHGAATATGRARPWPPARPDRRRDRRAQAQARPQMGSGIFGSVAVQRLWYRFLAHRRRCTLPAPGCWRCSRWRRSWAT
jgi:hypothetical protein